VPTQESRQLISADIIEGQPMANAVRTGVGCRQSIDLSLVRPHLAMEGVQFNGAKLVEANQTAVRLYMVIQSL
jgi:hypothetical protein